MEINQEIIARKIADDAMNVVYSGKTVREWMQSISAIELALRGKAKWENMHDGKATCSKCNRTFKDVYDDDTFDTYCRKCGAFMTL